MEGTQNDRNVTQSAMKSMALTVVITATVACGLILLSIKALPHLPLADGRTFYALLRAQMAVDEGALLPKERKQMVLFLGSSVVERGVSERYMDGIFKKYALRFTTMNAGVGGFCAEANLPMFRAMLDDGLRPSYVVYGVGIQELNGASNVHAFLGTDDTSAVKLKPKTIWNMLRFGPTALHPLLAADHLHQYLFAANNAFRDVPNLTLFDKVIFGENMYSRDSSYRFEQKYLDDLTEIARLCQERGIRVAFYNAPLRPRDADQSDVPYRHRGESYQAIFNVTKSLRIPLWNFDHEGLFLPSDFQDSYHLTPVGARKISGMLADSIEAWRKGSVVQDGIQTLD